MTNCNRQCMPSNETLDPKAKHYLDCPIWGFTPARIVKPDKDQSVLARAASSQGFAGGVVGPPTYPSVPLRGRQRPLYRRVDLETIVFVASLVVTACTLGVLYFGIWKS